MGVHMVHIIASEAPGLTWRPWLVCNVLLHVIFLIVATLPFRIFHSESRLSLVRALWDSLIAPLAPVTFWHVIVADYLTSLAKAMSDLQLTFCISVHIFHHDRSMRGTGYVRSTQLWDD